MTACRHPSYLSVPRLRALPILPEGVAVVNTVAELFWSKVEKTDTCWLWKPARRLVGGYGRIKWAGVQRSVHRLAWELANGPIPDGPGYHGWCVCHRCDVRNCVNPSHLFLGTATDNARDRDAKGRNARGEKNGTAKLRSEDAAWIRAQYALGDVSQQSLGDKCGVTKSTVSRIVRNSIWTGSVK